jgi:hypothetical protein
MELAQSLIHEIHQTEQNESEVNPIGKYLMQSDEELEQLLEPPRKGFAIKKTSEGPSIRGSVSPKRDTNQAASIVTSVKSNVKLT